MTILRIVQILVCLLICKTTILIVLAYGDYFPPNFRSDFLLGRQRYFFGAYQWAFYAHILSGPFTLLLGLGLISSPLRRKYTKWHRRLGRVYVVCVLLLLVPSGLWMAWYAMTGAVAAAGFATLSVATGVCAVKGWRAAVQRRFEQHRCWMLRCYVLLCSAVVLRIIGGASHVLGLVETYPLAAWISWIAPLVALEFVRLTQTPAPVRR